jgi:hypothetical protein
MLRPTEAISVSQLLILSARAHCVHSDVRTVDGCKKNVLRGRKKKKDNERVRYHLISFLFS